MMHSQFIDQLTFVTKVYFTGNLLNELGITKLDIHKQDVTTEVY